MFLYQVYIKLVKHIYITTFPTILIFLIFFISFIIECIISLLRATNNTVGTEKQ